MKNKIFKLLIPLLGLISMLPGCINYQNTESYFECYYELELSSDTFTEIYFPIPYDSPNLGDSGGGNYSKLMKDLLLNNNGKNISIIGTDKGFALKISFTNYVHIIAKKKITNIDDTEYDTYFFDELTLKNNSSNQYFIYSDHNDVKIIKFICYFGHMASLDSVRQKEWRTENYILEEGWNSVELN